MDSHACAWTPSPEHSNNGVTRYRCKGCGRWGYRHWPRGRGKLVQPIRAYAGDLREPKPEWTGGTEAHDREVRETMAARDRSAS